jgi:WD40 repeat protein
MDFSFDAFVVAILADGPDAAFALGDGTVRWSSGETIVAHEDGAILCAAAHPSGKGVVTGGDDGRLVWSRREGVKSLAEIRGRWIDAVATSPVSGLIAYAVGREVQCFDVARPESPRAFVHDKTVAALALDPKGRRLAAATYGGVWLWYAKIAEQQPVMLRWAGSHIGAAFSPDGRFLVSAMQESALHGWRLADGTDMRMGGYPAKTHSLAFADKGAWLATSGAQGVVLWPFAGAGPMGKQAMEIGPKETALVTRAAAHGALIGAGLDDGEVWACDLTDERREVLRPAGGAPISALAWLDGQRLAWGDEAGAAGVASFP